MVLFNASGGYIIRPVMALSTKQGRQIPNEQYEQRVREAMEAAKDMVLANHPSARVRSLQSIYNCMGMVFASRRTCIEPDHLEMILVDDQYTRISESEIEAGDLIVYRGDESEVSHVGMIARIETSLATGEQRVIVLSQWGRDGEYFHEVDDVNPRLGEPSDYWTDRK